MSLRDFVATGHFGPITPGHTRRGVLDALGTPTKTPDDPSRSWIQYGDAIFFFSQHDELLHTVTLSGFDLPGGGGELDIEPWIVRGGLPQSAFLKALDSLHVGYTVGPSEAPNMTNVITSTDVTVAFVDETDEHSESGLFGIGRVFAA